MGEMRNGNNIVVGKPVEKRPFERPKRRWRIILKLILFPTILQVVESLESVTSNQKLYESQYMCVSYIKSPLYKTHLKIMHRVLLTSFRRESNSGLQARASNFSLSFRVQRGYLAAVLVARPFRYAVSLRRLPRLLVLTAQSPTIHTVYESNI
jgi:hypothetical protein